MCHRCHSSEQTLETLQWEDPRDKDRGEEGLPKLQGLPAGSGGGGGSGQRDFDGAERKLRRSSGVPSEVPLSESQNIRGWGTLGVI